MVGAGLPPGAPKGPEWTFGPDEVEEPSRPSLELDPRYVVASQLAPRRPSGMALRVGVIVVIVGALVTAAMALTHVGPFHSPGTASTPLPLATTPTDLRGTWHVLDYFAGSFQAETMYITSENLSTGTFSGTVTSAVGVETIKGTVIRTTTSFTITFGTSTELANAVVSSSGTKVRIQGTFSNTEGGHGSIIANRTST